MGLVGVPPHLDALEGAAFGWAGRDQRWELERWACQLASGRGACKHPDGAAGLLRSALTVFRDEFALHVRYGTCTGSRVNSGLPLPSYPEGWR